MCSLVLKANAVALPVPACACLTVSHVLLLRVSCSSLVCLKEGYNQTCQRNIVDLFSTMHVSAMWLFS